ncbi:MAG: hypothetical protein HY716_14525 [Planctomycetes bacterium]|nr:hypothetical protein [Planctomycetota bacterium]
MTFQALLWSVMSTTVAAQDTPAGSWRDRASGTSFYRGGSASDGRYLYLLGGYPSPQLSTRRYDPVADQWASLSDMPESCTHNAGAYCDGFIYSFGNQTTESGTIYRYEVASDRWTTLNIALAEDRRRAAAAVLGSRIYLIGGWGTRGLSGAVEVLDTAADDPALALRAPLPVAAQWLGAAAVPMLRRIYAIGGYNGGALDGCYAYDPDNDAWAPRAPLNLNGVIARRYALSALVLRNRLYAIGGNDEEGQSSCLEYAPLEDQWVQRAPMRNPRYFLAGGVVSFKAYVYGGNLATTSAEEFTPPIFGHPPNEPVNVSQMGPRGEIPHGGTTNGSIVFSAEVTDPEEGQSVLLEIQVKPSSTDIWPRSILTSSLRNQGSLSVEYVPADEGGHDWRYRLADSDGNYTPSVDGTPTWYEYAADELGADFISDLTAPGAPALESPEIGDLMSEHSEGDHVEFSWMPAPEDAADPRLRYDIEVARDSMFRDVEASAAGLSGTRIDLPLSVSRFQKFWRVRAKDKAGNVGPWGKFKRFRLVWDDGIRHSAGDGVGGCSASVPRDVAYRGPMMAVGLCMVGLFMGRACRARMKQLAAKGLQQIRSVGGCGRHRRLRGR